MAAGGMPIPIEELMAGAAGRGAIGMAARLGAAFFAGFLAAFLVVFFTGLLGFLYVFLTVFLAALVVFFLDFLDFAGMGPPIRRIGALRGRAARGRDCPPSF